MFKKSKLFGLCGVLVASLIVPVLSVAPAAAAASQSGTIQLPGSVIPNFTAVGHNNSGVFVADTQYSPVNDVASVVRKLNSDGTEQWSKTIDAGRVTYTADVEADNSGVYLFGYTSGQVAAQHYNTGNDTDGFIYKMDNNGNEVWAVPVGSSTTDYVWDGTVDSTGVYIVGETYGNIAGYTNQGGSDTYIYKFDLDGNFLWSRQFGTDSPYDGGYAVYADGQGVYVAGTTGYNTTQALGDTNYGGGDAFVRKFDINGNVQWTKQFGGSDYDQVIGIQTLGSDLYVSGETYTAFPGQSYSGNGDAYIAKLSTSDGSQQWLHEFGSSEYDTSYGLSADSTGIYVSGYTWGSLPGQTSAGGEDGYVRKYLPDGSSPWLHQFGTAGDDQADRIAADETNGVVVSGFSNGTFPGQTAFSDYRSFYTRITQDDTDSDSIFDAVDTSARTYSNNFNDGHTYGTISTRGDQTLTIQDAPSLNDGVLVTAAADGGVTPAAITICGGISTFYISAGDSATLTCGSAIVKTLTGSVDSVFTAADGTVSTASVDSGNKLTFKPETSLFIADTTNVASVPVTVAGATVAVAPGQSFLPVKIDIRPGSSQNTINLSGNGVIPVAVLTTPSFDASRVDPLSIKLEGASVQVKGKSGNTGSLVDVDGDGDLDLLVQVNNSLQLLQGSTSAKLSGLTKDGVVIGGSDVVTIVP